MATDSLTSSATSVSNNDSSWVDLSVEGGQKEERHNPGVEDQSDQGSNTATTLEFQLTQALLDRVKANKGNGNANSGKQAQLDLDRMNFVINGKTINEEYVRELYNRYNHLISNGKQDYRLFAKQVFTEMFTHAGAEVPNDSILEELVTNCNQAGYDGSLLLQLFSIFFKYNLQLPDANDRQIEIVCNNQGFLNIKYCPSMPVKQQGANIEICRLDAILEFILKSQNGEVEYEDGKVTFTVPEKLKHYQANGKSLLGDIEEYFADADNAAVEYLEATFSEGPKSFVIDQESLNSDEGLSLVIVPESSVSDLGNMVKLVKEAVDNKDVKALSTYVDIVKAGVVYVSPQEGLSLVKKILEIATEFTKEQGKAWNTYPTMPLVQNIYATTKYVEGYISSEDYNKAINLKKILNSIITRLSNNEKSSGSKTALSKENSNTVNSTEISTQEPVTANNCKIDEEETRIINNKTCKVITPTKYKTNNKTAVLNQVVNEENNNQPSSQKDPEPKSAGNQQPQKNTVDNGKNIMNNEEASTEQPLNNNYEGGEMESSSQSIKSIKERLSDAILDINPEEVKHLVEQGGDDITQLVLSEALKEAYETEVGKGDKKSKNKLIEIREFLEANLKSIGANVAASPVGSSVGNISATTSGQAAPVNIDDEKKQVPVQPAWSESKDVQPDSPLLSPQSSASGDEHSGSSPSFINVSTGGEGDTDNSNGEYVEVSPEDIAKEDPTLKGSGNLQDTQPKTSVPSPSDDEYWINDENNVPSLGTADGKCSEVSSIISENPSIKDVTDDKKPLLDKTNKGVPTLKSNNCPQSTKSSNLHIIAASALAIAGIALGVAIAVYLEMLAVGIAVGACCLVAAVVIYYCTPQSSVENSEVEKVDIQKGPITAPV